MRPPRPSGFSVSLAAALLALAPAAAWAQPVPAPGGSAVAPAPAPAITMPVVKKNDGVTYPKQALDEGFHDPAEVSLILTIDATGLVTRAMVEKPVGHGFDEAAVEAAQKLAFEPATRDGKPIAARTRFVYRFTPPAAVLTGRVLTATSDRPIAGATVVVRDPAGQERTAVTGADGAWRVEGLPPGTYHVRITATGKGPHEADETVQAGEEASAVDRLSPEVTAAAAGAAKPEEEVEEVEVHGEKPAARGHQAHARPARAVAHPRHQRRRAALAAEPARRGAAAGVPGPAHRARLGAAGHAVLRRRHAGAARLPLRRADLGGAHRDAEQARLLPGQLQQPVRPRDGRHRRRGAAPIRRTTGSTRWRRPTSSTRACSRRAPSATRGGSSPSGRGARTSTCG